MKHVYDRLFVYEDLVDLLCDVVEVQRNMQELRQCEEGLLLLQAKVRNMEQRWNAANDMASATLESLQRGVGLQSEVVALTARVSRVRAAVREKGAAVREKTAAMESVEEIGPTAKQVAMAAWRGVVREQKRRRKGCVRRRTVLGELPAQSYVNLESSSESEDGEMGYDLDSQEEKSSGYEDDEGEWRTYGDRYDIVIDG